jgi:hypothetical protein
LFVLRRGLAGARDRLSILAESDVRKWFDPEQAPVIDLRAAVASRSVVYFSLDSDRRPLVAQMVAAALVSDLVTLGAHLQDDPIPTLVLIDEFSAVAAKQVSRLFGRARSAGISLLLATQEHGLCEADVSSHSYAGKTSRADGLVDPAGLDRKQFGCLVWAEQWIVEPSRSAVVWRWLGHRWVSVGWWIAVIAGRCPVPGVMTSA